VRLSVTRRQGRHTGPFRRTADFEKIWNDDIFHRRRVDTCVYTAFATVFKLCSVSGSPSLLNPNFKGKAFTRAFILLPFIIPTVLSTLPEVDVRPHLQRHQWMLFRLGHHSRINWLATRTWR